MAEHYGYKITIKQNKESEFYCFLEGDTNKLEKQLSKWYRDGYEIALVEKAKAVSRSRKKLKPNSENKWIAARMSNYSGYHYLRGLASCGPMYGGHVYEVITTGEKLIEIEQQIIEKVTQQNNMRASQMQYYTMALWFYQNMMKKTEKEANWLSKTGYGYSESNSIFIPLKLVYENKAEYETIICRVATNMNKAFDLAGKVLGYCWNVDGWDNDMGGFITINGSISCGENNNIKQIKSDVDKIAFTEALKELEAHNDTYNKKCYIKRATNTFDGETYKILQQSINNIPSDDILAVEAFYDNITKACLCSGAIDCIYQDDFSTKPGRATILFHKKDIRHIAAMFGDNDKLIEFLYNKKGA